MQKVCANSRPQWWVCKTNLPAAIRQSLWKKLIWKWKQTWLHVAWVLWFDVCTSRCLISIVYSSNERVIIFLSLSLSVSSFFMHISNVLVAYSPFIPVACFEILISSRFWAYFLFKWFFFWHFTQIYTKVWYRCRVRVGRVSVGFRIGYPMRFLYQTYIFGRYFIAILTLFQHTFLAKKVVFTSQFDLRTFEN